MLGSSLRIYLFFSTVVGLASSNEPESHIGRSVATGRAFRVAQVKGDVSDKRDNLALQVGGWAWGLKFYTVIFLTVETLLTVEAGRKHLRRRHGKNKDYCFLHYNIYIMAEIKQFENFVPFVRNNVHCGQHQQCYIILFSCRIIVSSSFKSVHFAASR